MSTPRTRPPAGHATPLAWTPPVGTDIHLVPAGQWWDAVKVPTPIGDPTLDHLAHHTGAVIEDPFGAHLYWLVPPDTATHWHLPHITVLSTACYLAVPPAHPPHGLGVRWRTPYNPDHTPTDPTPPHTPLTTALTAHTSHSRHTT